MILHFSHIGLTDGRTFNARFAPYLLPKVPSARLWRPLQTAATALRTRTQHRGCATDAPADISRARVVGPAWPGPHQTLLSGRSRPAAAHLVPGGQDPRPAGRDGDRELE